MKHALFFFSKEKNFCQDQMVNSENNCWFDLVKKKSMAHPG